MLAIAIIHLVYYSLHIMELNRNVGFLNQYLTQLASEVTEDRCQLEILLAKAKNNRKNIIEKDRKPQERMHKLAVEMKTSESKLHANNIEIQELSSLTK